MNVVILGTGNAAQVLGRLIQGSGHKVVQVAGRNKAHAEAMAVEWECSSIRGFSKLDPAADIYLVALSDGSIPGVVRKIRLSRGIIVHAAGSVSMDILDPCGIPHGVLYPLQSLRANLVKIPEIPFLVDGSDPETLQKLIAFARSMSRQVQVANDEARLHLHLAAVFTSNFMNHLFALTEEFSRMEGFDPRMLLPLITETTMRMGQKPAGELQTGPDIRGDKATQRKHLALLKTYPQMNAIYKLLSRSISQLHSDDGPARHLPVPEA